VVLHVVEVLLHVVEVLLHVVEVVLLRLSWWWLSKRC
jgi:hypothetical protein